jgi:hypothetical protein
MAYFAKLENNIVSQVVSVNNQELLVDGVESEQAGIDFLKNLFGQDTIWIQTSYNRTFRKNYAGVGFLYDKIRDGFIPPKPFDSWVLNDDCNWDAPVPMPTNGKMYTWDEESLAWKEVVMPNQTPVVHL